MTKTPIRAGIYGRPGTTPLRAGIYGRQSKSLTKSIDEQTAECEADAATQGWVVTERYADGVSASRFARKARKDWPRLLADLEDDQLDVLVLWESSRGDRDAETWLGLLRRCREHKVLMHVVSSERTFNPAVPGDWKQLASEGIDSHFESEKTSMRLRRALAAQATDGKPHGPTRYGYERVYSVDERGRRHLDEERPHPEQAEIVREIVRRVGRNDPVKAIALDLEQRQVPTPAGGTTWSPRTIRHIATSETYAGVRIHKEERHPAVWPALVTETEHLAAVRVLADPKRKRQAARPGEPKQKAIRPGRQKWLLSYLATCGTEGCGRGFHRIPTTGRYVCGRGCTSIAAEELDDFVSEVVCKYLVKNRVALRRFDDSGAQAARAEVGRLQAKLDKWRDSAARDETSPTSLARIEAQILVEIAEVQRGAVVATVPAVLVDLLDGAKQYPEMRRRFDALPVPARREVISLVADVRILRAGHAGRQGFDHHRVLIDWK